MKALYRVLGFLCVALGFLGVFLPLLPTTPFLLLALFLFSRSSPRWRAWVLENRVLGPYVSGYTEGKGLSHQAKWTTLALLWATILISAVWVVEKPWTRWLLLGIAAGVTVHILMQKTKKEL